jgi:hypothetical protein
MDPIGRKREIEDWLDDEWLDSALSQYGRAEPRAGLEGRVLANLQAERNRIALRRRWWWPTWWAIGTATALAGVAVAIWVGESGRDENPRKRAGTSTTHTQEFRSSTQPGLTPRVAHPADSYAAAGFPAKQVAKRRSTNRPVRDAEEANSPKLAQFPSPEPLSEQERMLMSFVAQYPESAALVAQAMAEALQQDLDEEAKATKDSM